MATARSEALRWSADDAHPRLSKALDDALGASAAAIPDLKEQELRPQLVWLTAAALVIGNELNALTMGGAVLMSVVGVWCVGMFGMVGNHPIGLLTSLLGVSVRLIVFAGIQQNITKTNIKIHAMVLTSHKNLFNHNTLMTTLDSMILYLIIWD